MKILAALPAYRPPEYAGPVGGGEISNRLLLEALAERGHTVSVAAISGAGVTCAKSNNVTIYESQHATSSSARRKVLARLRYPALVKNLIRSDQPDIVIGATSSAAIAVNQAKAAKLPVGLFIRAFENFSDGKFAISNKSVFSRLATRFLLGDFGEASLKRADFLIPNSEFMERLCREVAPCTQTYVVYPPLKPEWSRLRGDATPKVVSMVGTSAKKGTATVIALAERFPQLSFRIVGNTPDTKRSVLSNLTYAGWVDTGKEFGEHSDLVLVPSTWPEPFGRVAVEALAAGSLVLASNIGGLSEAVSEEADLLVDPSDIQAWDDRLRSMLKDVTAFEKACSRAREKIKRFEIDSQATLLDNAFREIVSNFKRDAI